MPAISQGLDTIEWQRTRSDLDHHDHLQSLVTVIVRDQSHTTSQSSLHQAGHLKAAAQKHIDKKSIYYSQHI
jgi:hypothetical protein